MSQQQQQPAFMTNNNYQMVVGFLRKQYAARMGTATVPERVDSRIQKTVTHYMTEVARVNGAQRPVAILNQEVVRESTTALDAWIRQQQAIEQPPAAKQVSAAAQKPTATTATVSRPIAAPLSPPKVPTNATVPMQNLNALFDAPIVAPANAFQTISPEDDDEEEDPVTLMKKAQKMREDEMLRTPTAVAPKDVKVPSSIDPTPQAQPAPLRTAPLAQDYVIPQEPIVKYREKEYNIFLTSSDRDWFRNRGENRYNFSVIFNPGNRTGYGLSPSVQERFRNIQRIEFVKAILPTESLTTLVRYTGTSSSVPNTNRVVNCLSLPFAGVRIAELNNNGFSTNPREDNTFAIVQYDATWNSTVTQQFEDGTSAKPALSSVGYTAFIPKFLKAQRVYEPTPLAGLQKMSFRIERHDGALLSTDSDVLAVKRICLTSTVGAIGTDATAYSDANTTVTNGYIYVQTSTYFPFSAFNEGDLVNIQGYTVNRTTGGGTNPGESTCLDFERYINAQEGLYVVGVAYVDGSGSIENGVNDVGYANVIILRPRYDDPTTGATTTRTDPTPFGGNNTEEGYLAIRMDGQPDTTSTAAIINISRQTHLVLRVITRDMDSGSNIRPDNV